MVDLSREEIQHEIEAAAAAGGPARRIRQLEESKGYRVLTVGTYTPVVYRAADWSEDSVVSVDEARKRIRIVLVSAKHPRHGAFRRLVKSIIKSGYTPVVVSPIGLDMPAILKHWNWRRADAAVKGFISLDWIP